MGRKSKIKVGDFFGMWKVIDTDNIEQHGSTRKVLCQCMDCDMTRLVFTNNLLSGKSSNCRYCARRHLRPTHPGHPRVLKAGVVIGTLTILRVVSIEEWRGLAHKIERPNYRRTVEAKCLCGSTIIRRVDVIKRDEHPRCHHCNENATFYRWDDSMTIELMDRYADGRGARWFDMTTTPPTEHQTPAYKQYHKNPNQVQDEGDK
jgi:hypothetical protein